MSTTFHRTLIVHKSGTGDEISINLTDLSFEVLDEVLEQEGQGIAQILYKNLPYKTFDAMMAELDRLTKEASRPGLDQPGVLINQRKD